MEVGAATAEQPIELLAADQDVVAVQAPEGVAVGLRVGPTGLGCRELGAERERRGLIGRERVVDAQVIGARLVGAQVEEGLALGQKSTFGVEQVAEHAVLARHGDPQARFFGRHAAGIDAQRVRRQGAVEREAQRHAGLARGQVLSHRCGDVQCDGLRAGHGHEVHRGDGGRGRGDVAYRQGAICLGVDQPGIEVPVEQAGVGDAQRAARRAVAAPQLRGLSRRAAGKPELAAEGGQAAGGLAEAGDPERSGTGAVAAPQLDCAGARIRREIEDPSHLGEVRRVRAREAGRADVLDERG